MLTKNNSLKLDRSNWKLTKLGDLALEILKRTDNPSKLMFDRFVGLDNFRPGDITIKNWQSTKNIISAAKEFKSGDILFARRNAYMRRASLVNFSGCCSGDAFVLRENHEKIFPGFLAFIMNSNLLWDYAISNAEGTMSKRVKWRDLSKYTFLLPPKKEQEKLTKLLWSADEMVEKNYNLLNLTKKLYEVQIEKEIHGINLKDKLIDDVLTELNKKNILVYLEDLGQFFKGKGIPKSDLKEQGLPCIRYGELYTRHHNIIRDFGSFISNEDKSKSFKINKNDLLLAGSGETIDEIGKSAVFKDDLEAYAGGDILIFRPYDMDGHYLGYLMNSKLLRYQLNRLGTGSTVMHIYNSDLSKIKVPKIEKNLQIKISSKLELIFEVISKTEKKIIKAKSLRNNLINQICQ